MTTHTPNRLHHYIHLTRLHKPVGTILLLWPALWGLWLAADGIPPLAVLLIFIAGGFVMRAAGCAINDYADRHIDAHVSRTNYRPLATGAIQPWEALAVFAVLSLVGFGLVLLLNTLTILLAVAGVGIIALYPFMKRYTHLPQVILGIAWAWSIPMAFAAVSGTVPWQALPLVLAVVCWTVVFDTFYAMVDRADDLKIGVKSTAILFGRHDLAIIGLLQLACVMLMVVNGLLFALGPVYHTGVALIALLFACQLWFSRRRDRDACFRAFMHSRWVGAMLFVAIALDLAL